MIKKDVIECMENVGKYETWKCRIQTYHCDCDLMALITNAFVRSFFCHLQCEQSLQKNNTQMDIGYEGECHLHTTIITILQGKNRGKCLPYMLMMFQCFEDGWMNR